MKIRAGGRALGQQGATPAIPLYGTLTLAKYQIYCLCSF